jgi:hypothetical protein
MQILVEKMVMVVIQLFHQDIAQSLVKDTQQDTKLVLVVVCIQLHQVQHGHKHLISKQHLYSNLPHLRAAENGKI